MESDPIGLGGGLNTYGYVGGNSLTNADPYGLWRWSIDPGAFLNWMFGNGQTVDLSADPRACEAYLQDAFISEVLAQQAKTSLGMKAEEIGASLTLGESIPFSTQGQQSSYITEIYFLAGGTDYYVASAVATRTESGIEVSQATAMFFRYDSFEDPFDLNQRFGWGKSPSDSLPNLGANPYDVMIHCSCSLE